MNMLKRIEKLTPAEEAILAAAPREISGEAARALDTLRERGLPGRKVEAWHYTDLRTRLKPFAGRAAAAGEAAAKSWLADRAPLVPAAQLPFLEGQFLAGYADPLPEGVTLQATPARGGFADWTDAVALVNTLLATDGVRLEVAAGAEIAQPVALTHGGVAPGASALRHAVTVGQGAKVTIIESHASPDGLDRHANTVIALSVGDRADVTWVIVQEEGDAATHLAQLDIALGEAARLTILVVNAGGSLVRREIRVRLAGADAGLAIRGVNLVGGASHVDVTTVLLHDQTGCAATEIFRNVATGEGSGVFQGQIRVAQIAQKTDARMACNTLLLSDTAEFSAKPELEIFADDVQCGHGATVTDILDEHLFYLRARGIPERQARAMLIQAFVEEVFDETDETLRDALNARIESWLEKHG